MQKPYRSRTEWVEIIKDKEANNLTIEQVTSFYNVSEASVYKWASIFRAEAANAPITEEDVITLINKSLANFDTNVNRIDEQIANLEAAKKDIRAKKANLKLSLKALTGAKGK